MTAPDFTGCIDTSPATGTGGTAFEGISWREKIEALRDECARRRRQAPRFIEKEQLGQAQADRWIAVMEAILVDLFRHGPPMPECAAELARRERCKAEGRDPLEFGEGA